MRLEAVKSPGIAHTSYYLSDDGDAIVIDPRRDIDAYIKLAAEDCANIEYILETHRNEDYVIGSVELKEAVGAEICHSKDTPFTYGDRDLTGDDVIEIGSLRVRSITTPGHTYDSICYSVTDTKVSGDPLMVFTGDTLFVGDVGRTDLAGPEHLKTLSGLLFDSIHSKLLPLGDQVTVYPAHTAGSICGSMISERESSTLGTEGRTNPLLQLGRLEFIRNRLENKMPRPPYFHRMEEWNLHGAPLLRYAPIPRYLAVKDFESYRRQSDTIVVDARNPDAFAASHMPGSLSIWMKGTTYYPGWIVGYDQRILLVLERLEDAETVTMQLHRIGYDEVVGYLCPGIDAWRNKGRSTESFSVLTAQELKDVIGKRQITLLDVREEDEYESGHIPGAINIYVGNLESEMSTIATDIPIVVTCSWGGRSSLAASILRRGNFKEVFNLLGGMHSWKALGFPLETSTRLI